MSNLLTAVVRLVWMYHSTPAQHRSLLQTIAASAKYRIPLIEAFDALAHDESGFHAYRVAKLTNLMRSGHSLPAALEQVRNVLPDAARSQIEFGVESGELERAARGAVTILDEQPQDAIRMCREELRWLAMTLVVVIFLITFVMVKIVPTFHWILSDFAMELTVPMQIAIALSNIFANWAPLLALPTIGIILWFRYGDPLRLLRQGLFSRLTRGFLDFDRPAIFRQVAVARASGKPLAGSMSTLARCHHNPHTRRQLLSAWNAVEQGADPWLALETQRIITHNERKTMEAAETLDNAPWVLEQLATLRQAKTSTRMRVLTRLLPPLAMLFVAAIVALVAVGMMSSLSALISNLG